MVDLDSKYSCQQLLLSLVRPVLSHAADSECRIVLAGRGASYGKDAIEMEAFARPLWGLVPFWLGGGREADMERFYRKGLSAGCDPENPDYWGDPDDCDQRFVEMAPIAFALLSVPQLLWDPLDVNAKRNVAAWLYRINDHVLPKCNWYFFRILVNSALRSLGCRFDEEKLKEDVRYIDSNYLGDGWYKDGQTGRTDYYSAFAMQFYRILLSRLTGECLGETEGRARRFAQDFIYWFAGDGAALPYGRSLTYRFAQSSFFSACLFAGWEPLSKGVMKGIINRNIRYFLDREIFSADHVLQVGYGYANSTMAEKYNAPGSPYWALKAFAFLALDDHDPYWEADEEPLPSLEGTFLQKKASLLIQHRRFDVTAFTPGALAMNNLGHFQEKYFKFAYSSAFPFSIQQTVDTVENAAPDSTLAFVLFDSLVVSKGKCAAYTLSRDEVSMEWSPVPPIQVRTRIIPVEAGHIRMHVIHSEIDCVAYDSAFALEPGEVVLDGTSIEVRNARYRCSISTETEGGSPYLIKACPNSNILYKNTVIPSITFPVRKGITEMTTMIRTGEHAGA
ncbi:MAG: DUF2264 domain-containing protein [Sphaerochaetaceae bacterium]|nr:DUF2264 domain-containing protein [Sphaerochaetaceae bacterium]